VGSLSDLIATGLTALRDRETTPLLARLREWLDEEALQALPKPKLGKAIGYSRNQWVGLTNCVTDGRLPIDNNDTELCGSSPSGVSSYLRIATSIS
jgi:hypothetical protein